MSKFELRQVFVAVQRCGSCPLSTTDGLDLMCGHDGKPVRLFDPTYHCPAGKWRNQVNDPTTIVQGFGEARTLPVPAGPQPQRGLWDSIKGAWSAGVEAVGAVVEYGQVKASGKHATPETIQARKLSCFGGEGQAPCVNLSKGKDGHSFCGACWCGERAEARLDDGKLEWTYLPCPLERPGFSNARGVTRGD